MTNTGRTTITINGKTHVVKFGMGALIHFSEELGLDVQETIEELTKAGAKQIKAIAKFIYSALYVEALYKDKEFDVTYEDVIDWVDMSHISETTKVVEVIMSGLSTITQIEYPATGKEDSKKK